MRRRHLHRRQFVLGAAALPPLAAAAPLLSALGALAGARPAAAADPLPFNANLVRQMARDLAAKPFQKPDDKLPAPLADLSYDAYRNIRFNAERAIWRGARPPFELQLLHRGFLFREKVDIFLVSGGKAEKVAYDPAMFRFEHGVTPPPPNPDLGFSGFRLHGPINRPDYFDEIAVFQGASYFRALGEGQVYGSSARGLAIRTGDGRGEEFPLFKAFFIEVPRDDANSVVLHALLDSPSATAAHRMTIRPGRESVVAVEMALFPRVDLDQVGLACLTSMFLFGPNDRAGVDDFRPAVRDAQGLAFVRSNGEEVWRPLANPRRLEISAFTDGNIRGFGLMQRQRSFFDYEDLEARYERRPSVWVEPIGDWGDGAVHLVEIPTPEEVHDNIVAFWRPKDAPRKGGEYNYTYRLHWGWQRPAGGPRVRFASTRVGARGDGRLFVLDLVDAHGEVLAMDGLKASVGASTGKIGNVVLQPNPDLKGLRLSFDFAPQGAELAELWVKVLRADEAASRQTDMAGPASPAAAPGESAVSETWIYRWTP